MEFLIKEKNLHHRITNVNKATTIPAFLKFWDFTFKKKKIYIIQMVEKRSEI